MFWLFVLEIMEVPISYKKVRGGTVVQWIGYQLDVMKYEKGITESKVRWIIDWIRKKRADGGATGRELKSALGRFSFVAGALGHVRPFLGPLFAWAAALAPGTFSRFPEAVRSLLSLIDERGDEAADEETQEDSRGGKRGVQSGCQSGKGSHCHRRMGGWSGGQNRRCPLVLDGADEEKCPVGLLERRAFQEHFVVGVDGSPGGHHLPRRRSRMFWKKGCHENLGHHGQFGELLCSPKNDVVQVSIIDSGNGIGMSVGKSRSGVGPDMGS